MPSEAEIPVAQYLDRFTPEVKKILQAARRLVKAVGPEAEETAYRGWPIRYTVDGGVVVALGGFARYANLWVQRGTELEDPDRLLGDWQGAAARQAPFERRREAPGSQATRRGRLQARWHEDGSPRQDVARGTMAG